MIVVTVRSEAQSTTPRHAMLPPRVPWLFVSWLTFTSAIVECAFIGGRPCRIKQAESAQVPASFAMTTVSLDEYAHQVLDAVDQHDNEEGFTFGLNRQQHMKSMMRAFLGLGKVEFKQRMAAFVQAGQERDTEKFVQAHWSSIVAAVDSTTAPSLASSTEAALDQLKESLFSLKPPRKFFSNMARGRVYQGRFERLLEAAQPDLLEPYEHIFRFDKEKSTTDNGVEDELLRHFAQHEAADNETLYRDLVACIDMNYTASAPAFPADGGRSSGLQGEVNLITYLEQQRVCSSNQIVAPVLIRLQNICNPNSNKKNSASRPNVIELPTASNVDLYGMSTELDAIVTQRCPNDAHTVRLVEVWEAKAALHPSRLYEALVKKQQTLQAILVSSEQNKHSQGRNMSCTLVLGESDERFAIEVDGDDVGEPRLPQLGIFGTTILSPRAAARRTALIVGEFLLETSPDVVRATLRDGFVTVPKPKVRDSIKRLQSLAILLQPIVVVMGNDNEEDRM